MTPLAAWPSLAEIKSNPVLPKEFVVCKQQRDLCFQGIAEKWFMFLNAQ